jgi:ribonuclease R
MLPPDFDLAVTPRHYQKLADKIEGKPEERILSYLMLRSLKQARYSERNLGHFALALDTYCHFTSPIRRYPDLMVHRTLKWLLQKERAPSATSPAECFPGTLAARVEKRRSDGTATRPDSIGREGPTSVAELEKIAAESSDAERRADDAERELTEWKKVQFMGKHLGDVFDGLIIQCAKFGFFVELLDYFVEGLVAMDSLEDVFGERFFYRESDRAIVGERAAAGRKRFAIGDRVRVQVDRVDAIRQRVDFSLAV